MVIFRENTEDIYAGIEWKAGVARGAEGDRASCSDEMGVKKIRFPRVSAASASSRSRARAPSAWCAPRSTTRSRTRRKSVTLVHKGNIMKFTEGAFRDWGYELVQDASTRGRAVGWDDCDGKPPAGQVLVKDAIADITLQQVLTRPNEFDVIATLNLNGDYLSDALAAQVGGIGIAPGANINYLTGHGIFEATHGTAPKYAGQDKVNPELGDPLRRDDAHAPRLERGRGADRERASRSAIAAKTRHLRLRPADGRRDDAQVLRVRRRDHREHGRKASAVERGKRAKSRAVEDAQPDGSENPQWHATRSP